MHIGCALKRTAFTTRCGAKIHSCAHTDNRQCLTAHCAQITDEIFEEDDETSAINLDKAIGEYMMAASHAAQPPRSVRAANQYYDECLGLLQFMEGQLEAANQMRAASAKGAW